ncbi:MAG: DNA-binding domain-containing protein, partial [Gammaproteobacteria bacterium]|nr:DNA-binding domain-containing protein [Gammaproteobacteria bacterium]
YRRNWRENGCRTLQLEFPVIVRLVGADYFRQTACEYLQAHPSRSGDLHHLGRAWPAFLRAKFADSEYAYLADVAVLEWALQEAMIAADDTRRFDPTGLAALAPEVLERLRLAVHPAVRVVSSAYPILRIWEANQPDIADPPLIDLQSGGEHVLIVRPQRASSLLRLDAGAAACLRALSAGEPLGAALDAALAQEPTFDLQAALTRWVDNRILVAWSLPTTSRDSI